MPPELIAQLEDADTDAAKEFAVWPVNMPIVDAFVAVATQWRTTALADGRVFFDGLDYAGVRAGLELAGLLLSPREWRGVRTMERAAAKLMNGG